MAAQQPPQSHQSSAHRPVALHRFHRIFRTGRNKPASRRNHRRDRKLVSPQHLQHNELGGTSHESSSRLLISPFGFSTLATRYWVLGTVLLYHYESASHFVHHRGEIHRQQRLLRIDHHIRIRACSRPSQPHRLAQSPLHPVALHRAAECAAHGEANAQSPRHREFTGRLGGVLRTVHDRLWPRPIKHGHARREMPPPQFVHALEVGMTQQPRAAGKGALAGSRHNIALRFSRHTGSHDDSKFQFAISRGLVQMTARMQMQMNERITGTTALRGRFRPRRWTIPGILVLPRPVCAPWRAGGKLPSCRPGSSCACEIRVSSIACAGWVGMYAWA
jgi:hypothetical protein